MANLYLISQGVKVGYDTYDSAVVCAKSEAEARTIHPRGIDPRNWEFSSNSWVDNPEEVEVEFLGAAKCNLAVGVIVASFNAG